MKLMAISVIILLLPLSLAEELSFDYPSSVESNENFTVNISYSPEEKYDVKVFLENEDGRVSSEIYYEKWKSSFYYLPEAFPDMKNFVLRANSPGENKICVRLKKHSKNSYIESCKTVNVLEDEKESQVFQGISNRSYSKQPGLTANVLSSPSLSQKERILLSSTSQSSFISKEEKIRISLVYSASLISIISFILVYLRKV